MEALASIRMGSTRVFILGDRTEVQSARQYTYNAQKTLNRRFIVSPDYDRGLLSVTNIPNISIK